MSFTKKINLEKKTKANKAYRRIIATTPQMQLVLMSLKPGEEVPREKHKDATQFVRVESGSCIVSIDEKKSTLKKGDAIVIPPNVFHHIINTSKSTTTKLYTLYSPPQHDDT